MIYNMQLHLIPFLARKQIVAKDLAFSWPLNDPPREMNGIHEVLAIESHWPQERQVEAKDYNTDLTEVMNHHTQYKSQYEKNEQEVKRRQVWRQ